MLKRHNFAISCFFALFIGSNAFALTVNTGDIADGAVTEPKIAEGAITTNKITDGTVTTGKIANNAVTIDKIADGSVTDTKITGPISASKISSSGLNADTVDGVHSSDLAPAIHTHSQSAINGLEAALTTKSDITHNHDVLYQQKYGKVAIVAKTGGDYTDPVTAMNDISTWCGTPSATNTCLLDIKPGIYDLGQNTIYMQNYVVISGSGEIATKLIADIDTSGSACGGMIYGASNAAIKLLTIENAGGSAMCNISSSPSIQMVTLISTSSIINAPALMNIWSASPVLKDVTVLVSNENSSNTGIYNSESKVIMNDVTISVTGDEGVGIQNNLSEVIMRNIAVTAAYGVNGYRSKSIIENAAITSTMNTIQTTYQDQTRVAHTRLEGGPVIGIGSATCAGVYDENYVFYSNSCP